MNLVLWLKKNKDRADQVQTSLRAVKGLTQRRLHKAFLRYHDADNWPVLREALQRMGRGDLIGPREDQLVPAQQPAGWVAKAPGAKPRPKQRAGRAARGGQRFTTKGVGYPGEK
ncbi:DUF3362 domain-containing protein [Dongia sp. agr-C8]